MVGVFFGILLHSEVFQFLCFELWFMKMSWVTSVTALLTPTALILSFSIFQTTPLIDRPFILNSLSSQIVSNSLFSAVTLHWLPSRSSAERDLLHWVSSCLIIPSTSSCLLNTFCNVTCAFQAVSSFHLPPSPSAPSQQRYPCRFCPASFTWSHTMKRHERQQHLDPKREQCPVCDRSFTRRDNMLVHIRTAHKNFSDSIVAAT